jgi:AraC family transcriptional regulator of adaptative response / DNA-3-methyladenine glycosylase II
MPLDDEARYQVIKGRDRRFEGRFVVGVRTTGVYCRPGCPAPIPKRVNVRFYACAAAAEEAGFRPCMRCRPETSPGTPAWAGTSATVARAMRLIAAGALDEDGVDALADRLGVGARHLRRLFTEHVGASPLSVARTRRVHFARKLIDETSLPLGEIALSSGFKSVRRFNDAMRATFRRPPSALRRSDAAARGGELRLRLPYCAPYDWSAVIGWLKPRAIAGVEVVTDDCYRRAVRSGTIEARPVDGAIELVLAIGDPADLIDHVERAARLFDLDADPVAIGEHLGADPALRPLIAARPGLRVPGAWDPFELAVRAILGQQITVTAATGLAAKIAAAFGEPLASSTDDGLTHRFPTPERLAEADIRGMPAARAASIRALAAAVARGDVTLDASRDLDDRVASLRAIKGIGPWTAQYIAMRGLGEPDAFPAGDLGLRKAWERIGSGDLAARAERWRPWRAYAAMALWMTFA